MSLLSPPSPQAVLEWLTLPISPLTLKWLWKGAFPEQVENQRPCQYGLLTCTRFAATHFGLLFAWLEEPGEVCSESLVQSEPWLGLGPPASWASFPCVPQQLPAAWALP